MVCGHTSWIDDRFSKHQSHVYETVDMEDTVRRNLTDFVNAVEPIAPDSDDPAEIERAGKLVDFHFAQIAGVDTDTLKSRMRDLVDDARDPDSAAHTDLVRAATGSGMEPDAIKETIDRLSDALDSDEPLVACLMSAATSGARGVLPVCLVVLERAVDDGDEEDEEPVNESESYGDDHMEGGWNPFWREGDHGSAKGYVPERIATLFAMSSTAVMAASTVAAAKKSMRRVWRALRVPERVSALASKASSLCAALTGKSKSERADTAFEYGGDFERMMSKWNDVEDADRGIEPVRAPVRDPVLEKPRARPFSTGVPSVPKKGAFAKRVTWKEVEDVRDVPDNTLVRERPKRSLPMKPVARRFDGSLANTFENPETVDESPGFDPSRPLKRTEWAYGGKARAAKDKTAPTMVMAGTAALMTAMLALVSTARA